MAPITRSAPPRTPTQPTAAKQTAPAAAAGSTPTASAPGEDLKNLQAEMKHIEDKAKKDPKSLTADERSDYAKAAGLEKVLENSNFIGFLNKDSGEKIFKKVDEEMQKFIAANPNASLEDMKKHAETKFKAALSSEVVSKGVVDMAIKQMQERLQEIRDSFEEK
ncbi:hypothetical protein [Pyxidicoccus trucidator]|uniref:hypothetical protein n=1 Tax=Pyxidicoccus trucidator TaxID=2709662 RepID=UPI0013D95DF3|nr:hypothetical protein [Pyxidicoccus trucidator]